VFERLHHVGIAVADLDAAVRMTVRVLGGTLARRDRLGQLDFALIDLAGVELELLRSDDPEASTSKFVANRGPGIHHLAYEVADLQAELQRLVDGGFEQSGEVRTGVHGTPIVFFHPRTTGGVLIELVQANA
jgi:methylmalonyl-CoA epimerase